jgi:hypothetical protein
VPTLTNTMGLDFVFRADAVVAVADRDTETSTDVTCVFGLGPSFQRIAETVDGFLTRIGKLDRFAKFTRPNGTPIWLNVDDVTVVLAAQQGLYSADTKTVIIAGAFTQAVKEPMDVVKAVLTARGAPL